MKTRHIFFAIQFKQTGYSFTNMKNFYFSILCFLLPFSVTLGQENHCGQAEVMEYFFEQHPEWRQTFLNQFKSIKPQKTNNFQTKSSQSEPDFMIPVVFHILHQNGPENISDAQVHDQIRILNRDYQKKNADTAQVVSAFQDLIGKPNFGFKLAKIDPNGNCTNGIIRHETATTNWDANNLSYFAYSWPRDKYLNIYVVKTINIGAGAYTFLPGTPIPAAADAIVSHHFLVGSIGTSNGSNSRAITHEVGHWFGLSHIWGVSNQPGVVCGDDQVEDTPITKGFTSCNLTVANAGVCNPGIAENVQNYMDYAPCKIMFTIGQADRMLGFLTGSLNGRNNLFTEANLQSTGVADGSLACIPLVDFRTNRLKSCVNKPVRFTSLTQTGPFAASRVWNFPGGTPSSSTDSIVEVQYPTPGMYQVSLSVTTVNGTTTETRNDYITVENESNGKTLPYSFDFETDSLISTLARVNFDEISNTWIHSSDLGANGSNKCFMLPNWSDGFEIKGEKDAFELPYLDFTGMENLSLSYYYSYARLSSAQRDSFKVQYSLDCGGNWTSIFGLPTTAQMGAATGGTTTDEWIPGPGQWAQHVIPANRLAPLANRSGVKFRFLFVKDITQIVANNIYVDQIQINGSLISSIQYSVEKNKVWVFPNPSNGQFLVKIGEGFRQKADAKLLDINGKIIPGLVNKNAEGELVINENQQLPKGIYTLMLDLGQEMLPQKLVVN